MTKTQIQLIRGKMFPAGETQTCLGYTVHGDNERIYNSLTSFITWDDTNEIMSCITINPDQATQVAAPFKIQHESYEDIQAISGIYNADNILAVSKEFYTTMTTAQENILKAFINREKNVTRLEDSESRPYFNEKDVIIPPGPFKPVSTTGTVAGTTVYDQGGFVNP